MTNEQFRETGDDSPLEDLDVGASSDGDAPGSDHRGIQEGAGAPEASSRNMTDAEVVALMEHGTPEADGPFWERVDSSLATVEAERGEIEVAPAATSRQGGHDEGISDRNNVVSLVDVKDRSTKAPNVRGNAGNATRLLVAAGLLLVVGGAALVATRLRLDVDTSTAAVGVESTDLSENQEQGPEAEEGQDLEGADPLEGEQQLPEETVPSESEEPEPTTADEMVTMAEAGLRFDYGKITEVVRVDGVDWIWFDRWSFGDLQGTELETEPRYELSTDWHGGQNLNPRVRSYPLVPEVSVLELDAVVMEQACDGGPYEADREAYVASDLNSVAALDGLVSLSFTEDGQVTLIRDQRGC